MVETQLNKLQKAQNRGTMRVILQCDRYTKVAYAASVAVYTVCIK